MQKDAAVIQKELHFTATFEGRGQKTSNKLKIQNKHSTIYY